MLDPQYLRLRVTRLKGGAKWTEDGGGLCFVFPKGGEATWFCGPEAHPLSPGDVFVFVAGSDSIGLHSGKRGFDFSSFSNRIEHVYPLFTANEIGLLTELVKTFQGGRLYPASSALAAECNKLISEAPTEYNLGYRIHLLKVAAAVLSAELEALGKSRPGLLRDDDRMAQTFESLSITDMLALPVAKLSWRFDCSQRQLNRFFHSRFGVSVRAWRMEIRLQRAATLLRNPAVKVVDVAQQSGFNSVSLFSCSFKRRFGIWPGQWRDAEQHGHPGDNGSASRKDTDPVR
jgi:AraC-like DNA-binding protein